MTALGFTPFPVSAMGGRQRDLFPLPALFGPTAGAEDNASLRMPSSRRSRFRLHRRLHEDQLGTEAVSALNYLLHVEDTDAQPTLLKGQRAVRDRVLQGVRSMGLAPEDLSPAEALGELRGASIYEEAQPSKVKPLDLATLSLPDLGAAPVDLAVLYGNGGHEFVEKCCCDSLAEDAEAGLRGDKVPPKPYVWAAANAADPFEERAHRLEFMLSVAFWRNCLTQVQYCCTFGLN